MTRQETQKFVPAVENAVKILRHMAARGTADGVAPIARVTGISVSTTFNILKTLTKEGLVSFDPTSKTYRIGMGVLEIVAPVLGANPNDLIRPLLEGLADEYRVMIALWQITENQRIVLIDSVTPHKIVHAGMEQGLRLPALIGAVGRCYAARIGITREDCEPLYDALRWQVAPGFDAYWQTVEEARELGFAFDFGNLFAGLNIAASMACDAGGTPRLGLSTITIAGQTNPDTLREVAKGLRNAAGLIETNVFGRPRDG